jgi:hypothetical protein
MKRNLRERLERLEEIKAAADRAKAARTPPSGPSVAERIREHLRVRGFVPTGNESLANVWRCYGDQPAALPVVTRWHLMAGTRIKAWAQAGGCNRRASVAPEHRRSRERSRCGDQNAAAVVATTRVQDRVSQGPSRGRKPNYGPPPARHGRRRHHRSKADDGRECTRRSSVEGGRVCFGSRAQINRGR